MINDWFENLEFQIDWQTFQALPRHPAYRYEYLHENCLISGRPRFYHAQLSLGKVAFATDRGTGLGDLAPVNQVEISLLIDLFQRSFSRSVPFCYLSQRKQRIAAESLLQRTIASGDGPLVSQASFALPENTSQELVGAILVTLLPSDDLQAFCSSKWEQAVPDAPVDEQWGYPHLTWIFVAPAFARRGIGRFLLSQSIQQLHNLGYSKLLSTFLLGHESSLLWHWKSGFELLPHVSSAG